MTPQSQRIAIAEACGWEADGPWGNYWTHKNGPAGVSIPTEALPNYECDLNAMHEAEKVLNADQMIDYSRHVGKSVTMYLPASRAAWMDFRLIHVTAAQRAEAFLRTLNLWDDPK